MRARDVFDRTEAFHWLARAVQARIVRPWTPELRDLAARGELRSAILGPRARLTPVRVLRDDGNRALVLVEGERLPRYIDAGRIG